MNKKKLIIISVIVLSLFVSCKKSRAFYLSGKYEKVLNYVNSKDTPTKEDYLYKAMALVKFDRAEDARESILLYLLLANEKDPRDFAVSLFIDLKFSDIVNVMILSPDDGLRAVIVLYKSYAELGDTENAIRMLDILQNELSVEDFYTLLINYPINPDYSASEMKNWKESLIDSHISMYLSLLLKLTDYENLTVNSVKIIMSIVEDLLNDERFNKDNECLFVIYQIAGNALNSIYDSYNALYYYKLALKIFPDNNEILEKVNKLSNDRL